MVDLQACVAADLVVLPLVIRWKATTILLPLEVAPSRDFRSIQPLELLGRVQELPRSLLALLSLTEVAWRFQILAQVLLLKPLLSLNLNPEGSQDSRIIKTYTLVFKQL